MTHKFKNRLMAFVIVLFAISGSFAHAHPGAPGHTHYPDEVDEFDQTLAVSVESTAERDFDFGGILVLSLVAACLGFALFQKDGGIWSDATSKH